MKPFNASLLISEGCNLNCSYCFEKTKKNAIMSPERGVGIIRYLYDNFHYNIQNNMCLKEDNISMTMFGGEPLLNFKTIKAILKEYKLLYEQTGYNCLIQIITNGTIINDDIIETLREYDNVDIQLSVDGLQKDHDFYRVYKNGRGSFNTIEKNIPKFKQIFNEQTVSRLHLHGSLNKQTIRNMYEARKYFIEKWDIPGIWFMPIHDEAWDDEDVEIYREQLRLISADIMKRVIETGDISHVNAYAPLNRCLDNRTRFGKPCGAGHSYITFTANGDIYPCHQFYFLDPNTKIGENLNIDEGKRKIYVAYDAQDMNCSKRNCTNYSCYRCIAENYSTQGTIFNCEISKRCEMSTIEEDLKRNMIKILEYIKRS